MLKRIVGTAREHVQRDHKSALDDSERALELVPASGFVADAGMRLARLVQRNKISLSGSIRCGPARGFRMYGAGIDLGTSFTAAAVCFSGTLDMVRLSGQAIVTPVRRLPREQGALLTGEAADRLGLHNPTRAAREFKRRVGDPTPLILAEAPHSPTALMAALLRSVLDTVAQAQGGPPDRIVLTHPAVWGLYRHEQFAVIPQLAGLPRLHAEPGSAAESTSSSRCRQTSRRRASPRPSQPVAGSLTSRRIAGGSPTPTATKW
jgi:hypothetical protein